MAALHLFENSLRRNLHRLLLGLHQLDVQAQRLELADEDVERLRQARRERGVALDDRLVDFRAPGHVVRLRGEQLLEDVRRSVRLERPDLHFAEPLSAELRLAAQRLLGDERVRPDRSRVNLVVDQVRQLQHVDVADGDVLLEGVAGHAVEQPRLAALGQPGAIEPVLDLQLRRAVEHGRGEVQAERVRGPAEMRLENLADVHTRRNAERVEHDLHRRAVRQMRHVLLGEDARDDALVAVAAGHLVADRQLALHRDVHLHELDDARRQLVAAADLLLLLLEEVPDHFHLALGALLEIAQVVLEACIVGRNLQPHHRLVGHGLEDLVGEDGALLVQALAAVLVEQIRPELLVLQHHDHALLHLVVKDADLVLKVLLHHVELFLLDRLRAVILFDALAGEDLHADDDAFDDGRADEAHVAGLLSEDRAEELLFRGQLGLAFRRHLADEDVARLDRRADADDAALVEIPQERLRHVRNVARDLLRPELRVARLDLELLDVDRRVVVVLHHPLGDEDRVLEVVAAPRHERDQDVASQRELAQLGARAVGQHLPLVHLLADPDDRLLGDAGVLVGPLELRHRIDVGAHLLVGVRILALALHAHDDALAVDVVDRPRPPRDDDGARVARRDVLHAGADKRRPGAEQRHGLALHVRSHQRAVGIVVLEERDQRRGHRDQLLGRHVDELDVVPRRQDEVARLTRVDAVLGQLAVVVHGGVRLRDDVLVLFPGGQVEGIGLDLDALLLRPPFLVHHLVGFDDVAGLVLRAGGVGDDDVVGDASVLDLAVRRLDEAELVDARVARQRRDEADVRAFRRFNRADAAVVRRVDVADLEPRALAGQTAGAERRETPLVRDLGERVGLVHELRELRRPEELANRGHDRLRVDQVVGHRGGHFLVDRHLLLDGALHPDQPDAELVLEELADGADTAVAQVVDVVHVGRVLPQLEQVLDDLVEVLRVQDLLVERCVEPELRVQLEPADAREIVLLRVEEHVLDERPRAVERRRIAGPQAAVDLDERFLVRVDRILLERLADDRPDLVALGEEDLDAVDVLLLRHRDDAGLERLVRLEDHLAGRRIDDVGGGEGALELGIRDLDRFDARLLERLDGVLGDLLARLDRELAARHMDFGGRAEADEAVGDAPVDLPALDVQLVDAVEGPDDLVGAAQAERAQEDRRQELPLAIDADVQQVLRVVLEFHPGAAVRDDLRHVERLVLRVEEGARRSVQLRDDDALGAVDDEGAVLGHQRDVAEVDLLLLDVADGLDARLGVLVPDHEADRHLERHGVGHAALLALVDVVLELQADGVAADVAVVAAGLVRLAAARAQDLAVGVGVGNESRAAVAARLAQVMEPLQLAALALPVADRILDELERRVLAEVADREDRLEHRLETRVLALARQTVHLQEALVGLFLDLDQVRNRNGRLDLREIDALAVDVLGKAVHLFNTSRKRAQKTRPGFGIGDSGFVQNPVKSQIPNPKSRRSLLDLDLGADFLELLLDGRGLFLGDPFLDRLGCPFDEVLGFLEAERGDLADDLDDVDLVAAHFGERDGELGLLFRRGRCRRAAAAGHRHRHRGRRRHAELRFERLHELRELQDADPLDVLDHLLLGHFGHCS